MIANGVNISKKPLIKVRDIITNVLFLNLCFVKTKKCSKTIAIRPKTYICGKTILKIAPLSLADINFSSFPI